MKACLMYRDRDLEIRAPLPWNQQALTQDLELDTLFDSMAGGDKFLFDVARVSVLTSAVTHLDTILYRQAILRDSLENPSIVRSIYDITIEAIESEKKVHFGIFSRYPTAILHRAVQVLEGFVGILRKLRRLTDEHAGKFSSEGFTTLFAMLERELSDDYIALLEGHLKNLNIGSILVSAELGHGNRGVNYVLRKSAKGKQGWLQRILAPEPDGYTYTVSDRDESGARALSELKDRGINPVANALAQSADHILSFFQMLRSELAFYIGCLNLHQEMTNIGEALAFPLPMCARDRKHTATGLYDICLALVVKQRVVGNDLRADNKAAVLITGANQGGKSTFLRSVGLAQIMMQSGMFVAAESFSANVCEGLFTHYRREEDATMNKGKLDEELSRMSDIADHLRPASMILFNESFAATNEREGSEIARQIVRALMERDVKMFFVTHLYDFARSFYDQGAANMAFLRAQRLADGERSFKIEEGEPLQTSYGEDLYRKIFDVEPSLWRSNG